MSPGYSLPRVYPRSSRKGTTLERDTISPREGHLGQLRGWIVPHAPASNEGSQFHVTAGSALQNPMRSTISRFSFRDWQQPDPRRSERCGLRGSIRRTGRMRRSSAGWPSTSDRKSARRGEKENPHIDLDRERRRFQVETLPALSSNSVLQIARATGLSLRSSSLIMKGHRVPHPVHFPALAPRVRQSEEKGGGVQG
jgi:hypothetical protein